MAEQKFIKDVILKYRKEKHLTQEELADILNVSNKTISKWERGISYPDITLIPTLAKALDINVSELFDVQEATPKLNNECNEIYNDERINLYGLHTLIASCILLGAILFGLLATIFISEKWIVNICYFLSSIAVFVSLSFLLFSSYQYFCFFQNKLHQDKYRVYFNIRILSYILLIYVIIMCFNAFDFKENIFDLFLVIFTHLFFAILPMIFVRKNKAIGYNKKFYRLRIILLFVFIINCVSYFLTETIINIICFVISQIINYATIFIDSKNQLLREN